MPLDLSKVDTNNLDQETVDLGTGLQDAQLIADTFEKGAHSDPTEAAVFAPMSRHLSNAKTFSGATQSVMTGYVREPGGSAEQQKGMSFGDESVAIRTDGLGKEVHDWLKDCIPCEFRIEALFELAAGVDMLDILLAGIRQQLSMLQGILDILKNFDIYSDYCQLLDLLNFMCVPDLQRMISLLMAIMTSELVPQLDGVADLIMQLVIPLFAAPLMSLVALLDQFVQLVTEPLRCVISAIQMQIQTLKFDTAQLSALGRSFVPETSAVQENLVTQTSAPREPGESPAPLSAPGEASYFDVNAPGVAAINSKLQGTTSYPATTLKNSADAPGTSSNRSQKFDGSPDSPGTSPNRSLKFENSLDEPGIVGAAANVVSEPGEMASSTVADSPGTSSNKSLKIPQIAGGLEELEKALSDGVQKTAEKINFYLDQLRQFTGESNNGAYLIMSFAKLKYIRLITLIAAIIKAKVEGKSPCSTDPSKSPRGKELDNFFKNYLNPNTPFVLRVDNLGVLHIDDPPDDEDALPDPDNVIQFGGDTNVPDDIGEQVQKVYTGLTSPTQVAIPCRLKTTPNDQAQIQQWITDLNA
jgi:hypothetical protein